MIWKIIYWLVWIWQFPQNILGFCISLFIKRPRLLGPAGFKFYYLPKLIFPVIVLGEYIFINDPGMCKFGYGRSVLSMITGPLFLFIVSIPGFLIVLTGNELWYLYFYANRWSMKLGGLIK